MSWNKVKIHFEGDPEDLIEVYYHGMTEKSWRLLFEWVEGKIIHIQDQYGYVEPQKLSASAFLSGKYSYIVSIKTNSDLIIPLSIIDEKTLDITMEKGEIQSSELFEAFFYSVTEIAKVIHCDDYIVCPEFKKEDAFIVNGEVLV